MIDFLIVGGGIAGQMLAWNIHQRGLRFHIFGYPLPGEASRVAGGVWNPLALRRINPGWKMQECIHSLKMFSEYFLRQTHTLPFHSLPIYHPLFHEEEKLFWKKKLDVHHKLQPLVRMVTCTDLPFRNSFSCGVIISSSGWLDVEEFLNSGERFFGSLGIWKNEKFQHEFLITYPEYAEYKEQKYRHVVFCEGWRINENPYFSFINLEPAKGEVLKLQCEDEKLTLGGYILNKQIFLKEDSPGRFTCGSTFSWEDLTDIPTETARMALIEKLSGLIPYSFRVLRQKAGIRPSTHDRRPYMGRHPEFKNLYVFNGLGSKGVFLAPRMCEEFLNFILNDVPLSEEVNIFRKKKS